ncbi:esterase FUS5-like isoform X7 [Rhododendron vialii]|uniref:esterase FUS5-like isoform X7 n=1 Tax=Rhododendron vialii TaxID=182163 RepID=UPI00265F939A|nr:esterase FUS5-like isoform X7 [Rhododendron vialii]
MEQQPVRKPRVLCLHAFRTSGKIFEKMTEVWPEFVREKMDLVFIDAPFPAEGGSGVQGKFDPPYYEWFQFNQDFSEYRNFDECIAYIEDCMIRMGPFDGLFGFSQGAIIASALPGMQAEGVNWEGLCFLHQGWLKMLSPLPFNAHHSTS